MISEQIAMPAGGGGDCDLEAVAAARAACREREPRAARCPRAAMGYGRAAG